MASLVESAVAVESNTVEPVRRDLMVSSPSGRSSSLSVQGEQAFIGPILECGIWTVARDVDSKGKGLETEVALSKESPASKVDAVTTANGKVDYRWAFASNLTSRSESDLKPRGELLTADSLSVVSLGGRSIWFYLALLGLLLLTTEWWLYQRRVIG